MSANIVIDIELGGNFAVEDVWPDGDAPEQITLASVLEVIDLSGSLSQLIRDWSLDYGSRFYVSVNGKTCWLDHSLRRIQKST